MKYKTGMKFTFTVHLYTCITIGNVYMISHDDDWVTFKDDNGKYRILPEPATKYISFLNDNEIIYKSPNTNVRRFEQSITNECNHIPKDYIGLIETFKYCSKCDKKL